MKKYPISIIIIVLSLFVAYTANAQEESDTGRPIWVLGHAANSHRSLCNALVDGANGVEIDVATNFYSGERDWSVAHDGYCSPEWRKDKNNSRDPMDYYVSLEEYLNFKEIDNISLLWLDIKTQIWAPELIKYVHRILRERYGDINKVPFSIVYGFYNVSELKRSRRYWPAGTKPWRTICKICADSLWVNEGINLAYEGTNSGPNWSGTREQIQNLLNESGFPIEKHFMTNGLGPGFMVREDSRRWQYIIDSRKDMKEDKYCARIGFWTCTSAHHGVQSVVSRKDDPNKKMVSNNAECDVVLIECRSDFFPGKWLPFFDRNSLKIFVEKFFFKHGEWYKFNNGHYRRANQKDKFYIKYSDPNRVRYE